MATELEFCGIRREADILAANACLPDYVGFVLAVGTRYAVSPETARELRGVLDFRIRVIGVFVDQSPEEIAEIAAQVSLDCIRLHGNESEESLERVRALTGKSVWRTLRVTGNEVLVRAEESRADLLLFDSGKGSGRTFAWKWPKDFLRPCILAGGLDIENVSGAIRTLSPRRIDASSALEADGQKNLEKMRTFAEAVRRAGSETER